MLNNSNHEHLNLQNRLKQLGLDETIIHKGVICTGATLGPTYLSVNPAIQSFIQPHMIKVNNVDELKKLGGIPDHLYVNGLMEEHHEPLQNWECGKNHLEKIELSVHEKDALCNAFTTYIYGNSNRVQSYKEAINKHYFPMQLALFLAEDVVVEPGHPLIIESQGDTPVGIHFNTVTIKSGGEIINKAKATWEVANFIQEATDNPVSNFVSFGSDAGDGGTPGPQGKASTGDKGTNGTEGDKCCKIGAGKGGTGYNGDNGKPGGQGGNGGDAKEVIVKLKKVSGPIVAMSVGGNGGNGGNGGRGGDGGNGGPGGSGTEHCRSGEQGKGGNGGDGGPGGKGGDGGNGKNVYIFYEELAGGSISIGDPTGHGKAGNGGNGGEGGKPGSGIPDGQYGKGGDAGAGGNGGTPGTVYVNNQPINGLG